MVVALTDTDAYGPRKRQTGDGRWRTWQTPGGAVPVTIVVHRPGSRQPSAESVEDELAPLAFDAPRIVLGRGASCDVRLPDPSVSGRHASIRARDGGWVVIDEGSTNGTRLEGERLSPHAPRTLKSGDVLTLGRMTITVRLGAARASPPTATRDLALALVARALGEGESSLPGVVVRDGPDAGAKILLSAKTPATIGRDPRCALRLTDPAVPPVALEVAVEGTRASVTRRDPRADALIGDRPLAVGEPTPWGDGVAITIGATCLVFDDPVARALDRSALGDDELVSPPEAPPKASPQAGAEEGVAAEALRSSGVASEPAHRGRAEPRADRRRSWRGATTAFEVVALVLALIVLGLSAAGFFWLLRK